MISFLIISLIVESILLYIVIQKWFKYEQELIDESKIQKKNTIKNIMNKKNKSENNKLDTSKKNVSKKPKNAKRAASI